MRNSMTIQDATYKTLNDIYDLRNVDDFAYFESPDQTASIEIWYAKNPDFTAHDTFVLSGEKQTHIQLGTIRWHPLWSKTFQHMQGEVWSPKGEANELIKKLGLKHTSMSVGDIIILNNPNGVRAVYVCASIGWKRLNENGSGVYIDFDSPNTESDFE